MHRRAVVALVTALICVATAVPGGAAPGEPLPEPYMSRGVVAPNALTTTPQPVVRAEAASMARRAVTSRTASLVAGSAWSWYMDPRVLATSSATYLSSVHKNGDIQITRVARGSSDLEHTVLHARFQADDHNAPSLTELPDGRIAAFWTGHTSVPARYRITSRPGDISSFGPTLRLSGSGLERERVTYTTLLHLRGNSYPYHLFTRRNSDNAWVMTRSKDLKRWTPAVRLFNHPTRVNAPYPKFVSTGWNTVHIAVSDTTASPSQHSSMYHLSMTNDVFRQSDGRVIRSLSEVAGGSGRTPRPIDPREATLVYDGRSADGRARIYDIAVAGGVPTLVLTTGVDNDTWTYKWFRLRGATWSVRTLDRAPGPTPSGITLRHDDPGRVFLVPGGLDVGRRELVEYQTADQGSTWRSREVTSGSTRGNRTPATPWGRQDGPVSVGWLAGPYTTFNAGRWNTTLTIETSDPAPVHLTSTWPVGWSRGQGVDSRITEGVGGAGVPGVRVWLAVRRPGQAERRLHSAVTDADGRVHTTVNRFYPKGTRVRIEVPAAGEWGHASTRSVSTGTDTTAVRLDSTWRAGWDKGVGVSANVTAVRDGSARAGTTVRLLVRKPGQTEVRSSSGTTDSKGSVRLAVNRYYPKGTRVRVHVPASGGYAPATSAAHYTG